MLKQIFKFYSRRHFSRSIVWKNTNKDVSKASESIQRTTPKEGQSPTHLESDSQGVTMNFIPNEFEKWILVYSGKYKSKSEIPPRVGFGALETAKSKVRIKVANILMVLTAVMLGYFIWVGKTKAKKGETISNIQMERERKIMEEAGKKKEY